MKNQIFYPTKVTKKSFWEAKKALKSANKGLIKRSELPQLTGLGLTTLKTIDKCLNYPSYRRLMIARNKDRKIQKLNWLSKTGIGIALGLGSLLLLTLIIIFLLVRQ